MDSQDAAIPEKVSADPAMLESVRELKIQLNEANDKVKRESGASIAQADVWKKKPMTADAEAKRVMKSLKMVKKEFEAAQKARKSADETCKRAVAGRKLAEDHASDLEAR